MAFGYEYLVVYLQKYNPDSFLLFVHNPAGSTKLRDYSKGREDVLGQPGLEVICRETQRGDTCFRESPHTVSGMEGVRYWQSRIDEYNRKYLGSVKGREWSGEPRSSTPLPVAKASGKGRATRGSQRQLQDYVNYDPDTLNAAIVEALPESIQESSPQIK